MIAQRISRCRLCGGQIRIGDDIEKIGRYSWGHADCVQRAQQR